MALADSLGRVATNVIKALGADVTIRYVTAGSYNTTTGTVTETTSDTAIKGVVQGISNREVDELIKTTDKRLIISANDVVTAPSTKDRAVISSVEYQIIQVNTIDQDNTAITHEMVLRA
jgi:hypothetical protein|tara:strand:+ start:22 stop:378 length:357 start_codon:yes stop_codon:yes gene_type:complete